MEHAEILDKVKKIKRKKLINRILGTQKMYEMTCTMYVRCTLKIVWLLWLIIQV